MSKQPSIETRRPFLRRRGLKAGISRAILDGPTFQRLLHGVLISADVEVTPTLRAEAALACFFDTAFASHMSAARVWGAPIPVLPGEHVTLQDPAERLRRDGVTCHVRAGASPVVVDGVRVSSLLDLFVELAEQLTLVDLVVVGDWMVRRKGVRIKDLLRVAERASRVAQRAARLVRAEVDSPMETRLRLLLVFSGLPEPQVNVTIRDVDGEPVRRFDLSWPAARLIVEYDGRHHIERVEQWESDLVRREEIDGQGWRLIVVIASGIYSTPGATVDRVHTALRARGLPGLPAHPSQMWRAHFPGHTPYI